MTNPEEKRYHVEGSPAESELTGVVSGETDGKEWTEAQDKEAMRKRLELEKREETVMETLDALKEKYAHLEDIARVFEDASAISDANGRLAATIDGLLDLSKRLHGTDSIEHQSVRTRISTIVNRLRTLL